MASLAAGRSACPVSCCSWRRDADRLRRPGWIDFDNYELARTIGIIALALILFEGGLNAGLGRDPAGAGAGDQPGDRRHDPHGGDRAASPRPGCSTCRRSKGCCSARSSPPPTARRSSRCCAARRCGAARAHARGRVRLQRPGRGPARARLHRLDPEAGLRPRRHGRAVRRGDRDRPRGRRRGRLARRPGRSSARSSRPPGSTRSRRSRWPRSPSAPPTSLHGSGFLAVYLAGLRSAARTIPAKRTVAAFHDGLGWVAQLTMFLTLGLLVFPDQLERRRGRGDACSRSSSCSSRGRSRCSSRRCRSGFSPARAGRARLGGPARRGAGRARDLPGDRGGAGSSLEFFNIVFFAVVLSTMLQGTTFEPLADAARA